MKRRNLITLLGGMAITSPLVALAQPKAMPMIGYLHFGSPGPFAYQAAAFRQGLGEAGYVEGQNVLTEYRWAEGHYDRLPAMAADLVSRKVEVIAAIGPPSAHAAKNATATIPIVFTVGTDPVADGLVASFARPGGNLTGVSMLAFDLTPKRLQLLLELAPQAGMIALLVNPKNAYVEHMIGDAQEAARGKGVQLSILKASTESEIDAAFAALAQLHTHALIVDPEPFLTSRSEQIVALTARHVVPAIYGWHEFVEAGGLISYGPSLAAANRQIGIYAGRILKGEKAADLPVQQPTLFELFVNLGTAKALGIAVSPAFLAQADKVIE